MSRGEIHCIGIGKIMSEYFNEIKNTSVVCSIVVS